MSWIWNSGSRLTMHCLINSLNALATAVNFELVQILDTRVNESFCSFDPRAVISTQLSCSSWSRLTRAWEFMELPKCIWVSDSFDPVLSEDICSFSHIFNYNELCNWLRFYFLQGKADTAQNSTLVILISGSA